MINQDYDQLKKRWLEYWHMENHDRPLISIYAPKKNQRKSQIIVPSNLEDRWCNMDYIVKSSRRYMENTYYGGEAFPALNPNLGPDILGAICGCNIRFGEETSWAIHHVKDWQKTPTIIFDENNKWWKQIREMTQYAIEDTNGDYLVGVTDLHPGTDGLVSLRGPSELCMDVFDHPREINKRIKEIFEVYKEVFGRLSSIISKQQQGSTNWMGIWNPEVDWYVTSSDFSCLISEGDFEEFVIPGLVEELEYLPASIYHLDGPGALRHLDRLLEIKKLAGVQWVYGVGQPSAKYWIPTLKKIQGANKRIQVHCEKDDLAILCEALDPEGVHLICHASDEDEARSMLKMMEGIYKNKRSYMC